MSLKLSVGISQKVGLPDYGSAGASCNLELELAGSLLSDPENIQQQVRQAYSACRQAVQEELARHQDPNIPTKAATPVRRPAASTVAQGSPHNGNGPGATEKQLGYARQLAGQIDGLGVRHLDGLAQRMFNKPVAELTGWLVMKC